MDEEVEERPKQKRKRTLHVLAIYEVVQRWVTGDRATHAFMARTFRPPVSLLISALSTLSLRGCRPIHVPASKVCLQI